MKPLAVVLCACGRIGFDSAVDAIPDAQPPPIEFDGFVYGPLAAPGSTLDIPRGGIGDLDLVAIYADLGTAVLAPPMGWTTVLDEADGTTSFRAGFYWHRVVDTDPTMFGFGISGSNGATWCTIAYQGTSGIDIDAASLVSAQVMATQSVFDVPSLTTTSDGDILLLFTINDQGGGSETWTVPADFFDELNTPRLALFVGDQALRGATSDQRTAIDTVGQADVHGAAWFVALRR